MSRFSCNITTESWRTMLDKVPVIGEAINDKLNKPLLDKFMSDPVVKKYLVDTAKSQHDEDVKMNKKEYGKAYGDTVDFSLTKPSGKIWPLAQDKRDERTLDHDDNIINYPYTINGIRFVVGVKGNSIGRVSYYDYRYVGDESPENNGWYEELQGMYPPTKDDLKKYWKSEE